MAQIRSIGAGIRSKGKVDGLVYVHTHGKTYARALPIMPAGMFKTPEARKRQATFKLSLAYIKHHAGTIAKSFDAFTSWTPRNAFFKANGKALTKALEPLAVRYMNDEVITPEMVDTAVSAYATANPSAIVIGKKMGYKPVYLNGAWPSTMTLLPDGGDNSTIVIITPMDGTSGDASTSQDSNANANNGQSGTTQPGSGSQNGSGGSQTGSGGGYDGD